MREITIKYDLIARTLHWITALVILWATISGIFISTQSINETIRQQIANFNISITTILIPIFILRILHRIKQGTPIHPNSISEKEIGMAKKIHIGMYALITTVLISGLLMMDHDFLLFNGIKIPHLINNSEVLYFFHHLHTYTTWILAACIVLHLLALTKHELKGNRILRRML